MQHPLYGVLAEFENTEDLIAAVRRVREAGYEKIDAFTPFPVEGLADAVGFSASRVPVVTFIGGRPENSWPAFIPITFELTILSAALATVFGMLALNGLPTPYHPVFNAPRFQLASRNRFFLCIKARDPKFNLQAVRKLLAGLRATDVTEIAF